MGQGDGGYRIEETVEPTPERLAKGGLTLHYGRYGEYKSCSVEGMTVLDWLAERDVLGSKQLYAAHSYLACKTAYARRSGDRVCAWNASPGEDDIGDNTRTMADNYVKMICLVSRDKCRTVEQAADTMFSQEMAAWIWARRHKYQEAFEAVAAAVEAIYLSS